MKRLISLAALFVLALVAIPSSCQVETAALTIHAVLVDKDLNQKPVPRLALAFLPVGLGNGETISARTGFDGIAELQVRPGKYQLSTAEPIDFQGRRYSWEIEVTVSSPKTLIELSNDNAKVIDTATGSLARGVDDLAQI